MVIMKCTDVFRRTFSHLGGGVGYMEGSFHGRIFHEGGAGFFSIT